MKQILLSESEIKDRISEIYEEERLQIINEKWVELSIKDKKFVLEFLKEINPDKSKLISEAKWYNTLGDIAGIFDPTGIIDVINGISYWRQGDKLFAVLSWVSAIPYLGDVIAKPVVGVMKVGGKLPKLFKAAAVAGDATKMGKIAKSVGGPIGKLVEKAPVWGDKLIMMLKNSVGRVPGLGKGLVKTIEEYVNIFKGASVEMKASQKITKKLAAKQLKNPLTTAEKELLAKELKKQSQFRGFRDYKGEGQSFMAKYLSGGMGRLWGNRATRSLMRRTKWYLGLLDFLGLANFVGPDELEKQYPDIENKIEQYNQTPNAQTYAQQEFGSMVGTPSQSPETSQPSAPQQKSSGMDAISALGSLLSGGVGSKLVGI